MDLEELMNLIGLGTSPALPVPHFSAIPETATAQDLSIYAASLSRGVEALKDVQRTMANDTIQTVFRFASDSLPDATDENGNNILPPEWWDRTINHGDDAALTAQLVKSFDVTKPEGFYNINMAASVMVSKLIDALDAYIELIGERLAQFGPVAPKTDAEVLDDAANDSVARVEAANEVATAGTEVS